MSPAAAVRTWPFYITQNATPTLNTFAHRFKNSYKFALYSKWVGSHSHISVDGQGVARSKVWAIIYDEKKKREREK